MKWTIAALILVGLIAAGAAAVLAVTLKTDFGRSTADAGSQKIEIIVASKALPAMSMIESNAIAKITATKSEAPANAVTNSAQIIGRVLLVPILEGQAFTTAQFATSDSGLQLAATIPEGSRAMSVMLSDETGIEDLLYPGSIVDVVASFRLPTVTGGTSAEVVSVTLLQGLQVLAIGGRSIISEEKDPTDVDPSGRRGRMITLMVNTAQAEALQLAATHGKVSVSLRNPLDMALIDVSGTRISELSKDLAERIRRLTETEVGAAPLVVPELLTRGTAGSSGDGSTSGTGTPGSNGASGSAAGTGGTTPAGTASSSSKPPPTWETLILRGRSREIQKFEVKEDAPQ